MEVDLCLQHSAISPLGTSVHLLTVCLNLPTPHDISNEQNCFGEKQSLEMNLVFELSSISFLSQSCVTGWHLNDLFPRKKNIYCKCVLYFQLFTL